MSSSLSSWRAEKSHLGSRDHCSEGHQGQNHAPAYVSSQTKVTYDRDIFHITAIAPRLIQHSTRSPWAVLLKQYISDSSQLLCVQRLLARSLHHHLWPSRKAYCKHSAPGTSQRQNDIQNRGSSMTRLGSCRMGTFEGQCAAASTVGRTLESVLHLS